MYTESSAWYRFLLQFRSRRNVSLRFVAILLCIEIRIKRSMKIKDEAIFLLGASNLSEGSSVSVPDAVCYEVQMHVRKGCISGGTVLVKRLLGLTAQTPLMQWL